MPLSQIYYATFGYGSMSLALQFGIRSLARGSWMVTAIAFFYCVLFATMIA